MKTYKDIFENKEITQMGLGLLGRGVGDAVFLAKNGAHVHITDLKSGTELEPSTSKLNGYTNITYTLGEHNSDDFKNKDLILKGASVPLNSPYIQEARKNNVPVDMSASLFFRIAQIPIVGITGTRGKSTVTHLVEEILRADVRRVLLGGNVKGVSNLSLLEHVEDESLGVFELDSWQCQGLGEEISLQHARVREGPYSPNVAVFTTFFPDHMNYYKDDMDAYLKDKANIFLHQSSSDIFVIGSQVLPFLEKYKKEIKATVVVADENTVPKSWSVALPGVHNRYNAGIATTVARELGVDDSVIQTVLENTKPIAGRLESIGIYRDVGVYNDTNATTPDATLCALEALGDNEGKKLVLIAGGAHKGLDVTEFAKVISQKVDTCILLKGTGTEKLKNTLQKSDYTEVESMDTAVKKAFESATKGDTILLSPAFASFGMFTNEFDRGEQFLKAVETYGGK